MPPEGATWTAVAVEGGALMMNFVPVGKLVQKGKVIFRRLKDIGNAPEGGLPARDFSPGETVVRSCVTMCFVAGTKVKGAIRTASDRANPSGRFRLVA